MKDLTLSYAESSKRGTHSQGEPILDQYSNLIRWK